MCVQPQLRIGCSGWNYKSWKGRFYPPHLPASKWLDHYAGLFDTVEINNTFYRLPETATFASWRSQTPARFLIAVKASRFLTHMKRLRDPEEPLERMFARVAALGPRLGPVLYQLPGHFHADPARLEHFLRVLPRRLTPHGRRLQHVIEFRHPSWYTKTIFDLMERHEVALCLHDKTGSPISGPWIGPCSYVRFHGTSGDYHGDYPDTQLRRWARRLAARQQEGSDVYAYFNNDPDATATRNALTLRRMVDQHTQHLSA